MNRNQGKGLTLKQRVKVNAALSLIHGQGGNAEAISQQAKGLIGRGLDARAAYERAINAHLQQNPTHLGRVSKVLRVVEASNDQTVTAYDKALSEYIRTGREAALEPVMSTLAHDSVALAMRNGEMTASAVNTETVQAALGVPLAPNVIGHKVAFQQPQEAQQQIGQTAPQQARQSPSLTAPAPARDYGSQAGSGYGPMGYVAKGSQARWAQAARNDLTFHSVDPRASMTREQVATSMQGSRVVNTDGQA